MTNEPTSAPSSSNNSGNSSSSSSSAVGSGANVGSRHTAAASGAATATTATSESNNSNNSSSNNNNNSNSNNEAQPNHRQDNNESGKILAALSSPAECAPLSTASERQQAATTIAGPKSSGATSGAKIKIERQEGAPPPPPPQPPAPSPQPQEAESGASQPPRRTSVGAATLKSEPAGSDGNNNREQRADGAPESARDQEAAGRPASVVVVVDGASVLLIGEQQVDASGPAASGQRELPIKVELGDVASPEYALLKPVTPVAAGQTNPGQRQHSAATILTDLDAAAAAPSAHHQPNHQLRQQHELKIEQHQEQLPPLEAAAGPLTELAPAAVGATFSELTSVNPVTIEHHPQQFDDAHHSQLQQHESHLVDDQLHTQELQHQHHHHHHHHHQDLHQHQAQQMGYATYQLAGAGHLPAAHQTQQLTPLLGNGAGEQATGAQTFDQPTGASSAQEAAAAAAAVPASGSGLLTPSSQRFQTTGPPSASSVASSGGMTTPTGAAAATGTGTGTSSGSTTGGSKRRSWSQMNRNANKTEIAKVYSQFGFRCFLEAPISTCRRKEEDRITYINKGEFYGLTLDYVPDPGRPLRSSIVKVVVMLVFREDKSPEDDLKSWQFWHSRQHSAKQRILDVDNKNHLNVINQIEEISLNATAFYWNPFETRQAKLNIAIQCLSTDFSNQKGVKGLPLNLQVDIYDLFTETSAPVYRAYSTLLSYCDKGAQRRSRDEERRALKRKLADQSSGSATAAGGGAAGGGGTPATTASAAKKFEDLYHKPCDRTEFYSMADLIKAPTLYSPTEAEALGLAAAGAISDMNSNSGGAAGSTTTSTTTTATTAATTQAIASVKQPMSQTSGLSITPISATTPIPPTVLQDQQQQQIQSNTTGLPYSQTAVGNPQQQQQLVGPRTGLTLAGGQTQFGVSATAAAAPMSYGSGSSGLVVAEYMTPVAVASGAVTSGMPTTGQIITSLSGTVQQQQHPPGIITQQHLVASQQHQMIDQNPSMQQQQQQHQHPHQQHQQQAHSQHQQHHQQQQQHHHYHSMTTSNTLQPSYGIIQPTGQPVAADPSQQQQQQQYAILQPSLSMAVQHSPSGSSHLHPHSHQHVHHQQQQQQQQMMSIGQQQQQQHVAMNPMDPTRGQMQHQGSMMMVGGGTMQQQHQMQGGQQHGHYMAAGPPPANNLTNLTSTASMSQGQQQQQQQQQPFAKRPKLFPGERVLIYAKQADEKDFYPLHLSPPSLSGLVYAIEQKYKIDSTKVANIYKRSKKGIRVQMDDDMIRHYCNEDMVQLEVIQTSDSQLEITLVEL